MNEPPKPFFLQALDALKSGDRRAAAALLSRELREGNTSARNLPSVSQLAGHIGEVDLAVEASRRTVVAGSVESLLAHWAVLAAFGRSNEAAAEAEQQPGWVTNDPSVLHFRGTVATQFGRFEEAEELFRRALAAVPTMTPSWLSLAMIKTFRNGDADISAMERLDRQAGGPPEQRAMLCYALGKAYDDCGDANRAFDCIAKGAALCRRPEQVNASGYVAAADRVIREFTVENLERLLPSRFEDGRSLFVTGLPRSGTTLAEQILLGHSSVTEGEEVNLFGTALMPTRGIGFENALAYERASSSPDPWREIAQDYAHLIDQRFRSGGLVVDKSLGQSLLTGLMLHALPDARIAWLRRTPDDVALSCFSTYFSTGLPWTRSLTDIADHMRAEDRLFSHWQEVFPDRILVVPYEELVEAPASWAERLQHHFGLPIETGIENRPKAGRAIGSASVNQARKSISTARVGRSAAYERHLKPFRDRYYA